MTMEEHKAFEWALTQCYQSVAAKHAKTLAKYIQREQAARESPQPLTGWIRIKDRLPDRGKRVLCYAPEMADTAAAIQIDMGWSCHSKRTPIAYWMLLPEPPKEPTP